MSNLGIFTFLADPEFWARAEEKQRIAERVAEQMGVSVQDANDALDHFAADLSNDGQTLN